MIVGVWAPAPFGALLFFVVWSCECVGRYAYLTGGCALLPYAWSWLLFLPPVLSTVAQGFKCVSVLFILVLY